MCFVLSLSSYKAYDPLKIKIIFFLNLCIVAKLPVVSTVFLKLLIHSSKKQGLSTYPLKLRHSKYPPIYAAI